VCGVSGHEEPEGTFYGAHPSLEETEDEAARDAWLARVLADKRAQRWYSDTMTLRAVTLAIYAAEGWPAAVGNQSSRGDQLVVTLTICHHDRPDADLYSADSPRIEVTTSIDGWYRGELTHGDEHYLGKIPSVSSGLQSARGCRRRTRRARTGVGRPCRYGLLVRLPGVCRSSRGCHGETVGCPARCAGRDRRSPLVRIAPPHESIGQERMPTLSGRGVVGAYMHISGPAW
jgi:hypothetical protein